MKKENLIEVLQNWSNKNANKEMDAMSMIRSADLLDVNELYQDEQVGVNEAYYIITLPSELSLTGVQQKFMYQTTDLIFFDNDGDIYAVKSVDYKLLTNS